MAEYEPTSNDDAQTQAGGRLKRWTANLTQFQRLLAAAGGVIGALAVVVGAVIGLLHIDGGTHSSSATKQPSPPDHPVSVRSAPVTSTTVPVPSSQALVISVACQLPSGLHEGDQTTATYTITSNQSIKVGLGAGVYGSDRNDYSNGDGDIDGQQLIIGSQPVARGIHLPSGLPVGRYEIVAEIWPNGKIGMNGVEVLAEATCGYFSVP